MAGIVQVGASHHLGMKLRKPKTLQRRSQSLFAFGQEGVRHVGQIRYLYGYAIHLHNREANVPIEARNVTRLMGQVRHQMHLLPQPVELRRVAFTEILFEQGPINTKGRDQSYL